MKGLILGFNRNRAGKEQAVLRLPNNDVVNISYLGTDGSTVRFNIDAPKDVKIFRVSAKGVSNEIFDEELLVEEFKKNFLEKT